MIPTKVITAVLVRSRRRCCICFGLDRDTRLKAGQIAHLNQCRDDNSEDNLAFLCLEHHDEYDSRTSQRKGLTIEEVKHYRDELIRTVNKAFTQQVHFGEIKTPPMDPYAGEYTRVAGSESAEIILTPLPDSYEAEVQYFVRGMALWGSDREYGPNLGTIEFIGAITSDRRIIYRRPVFGGGEDAQTTIKLLDGGAIEIEERNWLGQYGMNVNFIGLYQRNQTKVV